MQLYMLAIFAILTVVAFGLWKVIDKFIKIKLIVVILRIFIMMYYLGSIIMLIKVMEQHASRDYITLVITYNVN